jgi:hypothetical protein
MPKAAPQPLGAVLIVTDIEEAKKGLVGLTRKCRKWINR